MESKGEKHSNLDIDAFIDSLKGRKREIKTIKFESQEEKNEMEKLFLFYERVKSGKEKVEVNPSEITRELKKGIFVKREGYIQELSKDYHDMAMIYKKYEPSLPWEVKKILDIALEKSFLKYSYLSAII